MTRQVLPLLNLLGITADVSAPVPKTVSQVNETEMIVEPPSTKCQISSERSVSTVTGSKTCSGKKTKGSRRIRDVLAEVVSSILNSQLALYEYYNSSIDLQIS